MDNEQMKKLLIEAGLWEEGLQLVALENEGEILDIFPGLCDHIGDGQKKAATVEEKK